MVPISFIAFEVHTVQLKFNFILARRHACFRQLFAWNYSYFSSNSVLLTILACAHVHFLREMYVRA